MIISELKIDRICIEAVRTNSNEMIYVKLSHTFQLETGFQATGNLSNREATSRASLKTEATAE